MAASIRASTAATATSAPTAPAGTTLGDLVIVFHWTKVDGNGVPTHTLQANFKEIATRDHDDGTTDGRLSVAAKVCTVGGAQTYQAYVASAGTSFAGLTVLTVGTWERDALLTQIGDINIGTTTTTNAQPNPLSIVTPQAQCLVFTVAAWHLTAAASGVLTAPTGYTNLVEMAGSVASELAWASKVVATATTEDPGAWTDAITPNGTSSITFAIRPRNVTLDASVGAVAFTGVASTFSRTLRLEAAVGTLALTGVAAGLTAQRTLVCATGAFALAGIAASLDYEESTGVTVDADAGAFPLSGVAAGFTVHRQLSAATGAFALSGPATGLRASRTLTSAAGAFALATSSAGLSAGRTLSASAGSIPFTGVSAIFSRTRRLTAETGSIPLTGTSTGLTAARVFALSAGSFSLSGQDVSFATGLGIVASGGEFPFAGSPITFTVARRLSTDAASFAFTGVSAGLAYAPILGDYTLAAEAGAFAFTGVAASLTETIVSRPVEIPRVTVTVEVSEIFRRRR